MKQNEIILGISVLTFFFVGGIVDYWQNAKHHRENMPLFLEKYFAFFWIILYSGILPFVLVFAASNFNFGIARIYLGFFLIGTVLWDLVFSLLDKKTLVSDQEGYWFWGRKNYFLNKTQITILHFVRLGIGLFILLS